MAGDGVNFVVINKKFVP